MYHIENDNLYAIPTAEVPKKKVTRNLSDKLTNQNPKLAGNVGSPYSK